MAEFKIVVIGSENDPLEIERAELAGLDVEFEQSDPQSEGEAMEAVRDADAIMMRGQWGTAQVITATEHCQVLAVDSHGFDHIDLAACTDKGMILTNGAGMCAEEVSDQAVAFIMSLYRNITKANSKMKSGEWDRDGLGPIYPLDEAVLGLVGLGNIGRAVARKMSGWRMKTLAYDPYVPPWTMKEYGIEQVADLNELFARSDYVSVQVPLNSETRHMIGTEQFDQMKETAYFINVCRGPVVDEPALITALKDGKLRGAGLDVFEQEPVDPDNPLLKMDNVIVAPHMAGSSVRSGVLARYRTSQQVAAVLRGDWPMAGQNPEVRANIPLRRNTKVTA